MRGISPEPVYCMSFASVSPAPPIIFVGKRDMFASVTVLEGYMYLFKGSGLWFVYGFLMSWYDDGMNLSRLQRFYKCFADELQMY